MDLLLPLEQASKFWEALIQDYGGMGGRGSDQVINILRQLSVLARKPSIIIYATQYIYSLFKIVDHKWDWLISLFTGQIGISKLVMHNYIDQRDLQYPISDQIKQRLEAFSFRCAVKVANEWQPVPMCMVNARYR